MNKPNKPKLIYDDDIAELFDGQELEVPAALDDHIRSMARAELKPDSALGTSLTSRYAPLFATAAVMLLAVALVPVLIDRSTLPAVEPNAAVPEYSLDSSDALSSRSESASAEERADAVAIEQPAALEAPSVVKAESAAQRQKVVTAAKEVIQESELELAREQSALIGGSAGTIEEEADDIANNSQSLVKQASPKALSEFADAEAKISVPNSVMTIQAKNAVIAEDLSIKNKRVALEADSVYDYRVSKESWLIELNRLYKVGEQKQFLGELTLFKKRHPTFHLSEHLPADALKLGLDVEK